MMGCPWWHAAAAAAIGALSALITSEILKRRKP